MLARNPMEPATQHDRTLAELIQERNNYVDHTNRSPLAAHMMNLSEEEGHVFDHEPGMSDYHHEHMHEHDEHTRHQEYYAGAHSPVNLEHDPSYSNHVERNDAEANPLYHAWAYYQPQQSHDWMLHTREAKSRTFDDFDELEFRNGADQNGVEADSLDFV